MRGAVVGLLLFLLVLSLMPADVFSYGVSGAASWNPIQDIINKLKEAILEALKWLADRIHDLAMGPLAPLFQAVTKLVIGNPVPEYGDWGPRDKVSWYEIRVPEMLELYGKARVAAYILLPIPIVVGALAIGLEGFGIVKEGEGMLMIKKSLWVAILIPLSMILYSYSAHLLSALTYYLCPPDVFGYYFGLAFTGVGLLALLIDPLIFLFIIVIAIAGAIRVLVVATLAAIMPILLVLSLIPRINRIAFALIETLIALMLVQLVGGAMIAMASVIVSGIPDTGLAESLVRIMIALASLSIPLLAPMLIGRGGFASFAASALLGYTVYPAMRMLRGYLLVEGMRGFAWGVKAGVKAGRYIYRGAKALPRLPRIIREKYENKEFEKHWDTQLYEEWSEY